MVLATTSRMPTVAEQDRLQAALGNRAGVYVERGPRPRSETRTLLLLAVVAGVITLGAAAGLGGSVAVLLALNRGDADLWPAPTPYPVTLPWLNLAVALLVVPAVAMLGTGLLTRSRLPIERRR